MWFCQNQNTPWNWLNFAVIYFWRKSGMSPNHAEISHLNIFRMFFSVFPFQTTSHFDFWKCYIVVYDIIKYHINNIMLKKKSKSEIETKHFNLPHPLLVSLSMFPSWILTEAVFWNLEILSTMNCPSSAQVYFQDFDPSWISDAFWEWQQWEPKWAQWHY